MIFCCGLSLGKGMEGPKKRYSSWICQAFHKPCVCVRFADTKQRVEDSCLRDDSQVPVCVCVDSISSWFVSKDIFANKWNPWPAWHSDITLQWSKGHHEESTPLHASSGAVSFRKYWYSRYIYIYIYAIDWYRTNAARIRYDKVLVCKLKEVGAVLSQVATPSGRSGFNSSWSSSTPE